MFLSDRSKFYVVSICIQYFVDFLIFSVHSKLKRPSPDDEQSIKSEISSNILLEIPHKSSLSVASAVNMHQPTLNSRHDELAIGVPSRFCSVCGDISTGMREVLRFDENVNLHLFLKEFISAEIVAKVAKRSFVVQFNAVVTKTIDVQAKVN